MKLYLCELLLSIGRLYRRIKFIQMNKRFKIEQIKLFLLFALAIVTYQNNFAQELYIGAGSEFFIKNNTDFTTSSSVITVASNGKFSVEAGSDWGSSTEYVDGEVTAYGTGETKLPVGNNGVYLPVNANHIGNIIGSYFNSAPASGALGTNVDDTSEIEYWQLSGNAIITLPWNENSDITSLVNDNGGEIGSVAIVGLNTGTWNLVSAPQTNVVTGDLLNGDVTSDNSNEVALNGFSQFTFGIDHQVVLAVDDLFLSTGINILSNPISAHDSNIQFTASDELKDLKVTLYDIMGRELRFYHKISTSNGIGNLPKPNLQSGIYLLKFEHEGKQGVKKIIIE